MSASRVLFVTTGIAAAAGLASWILGIWASDGRWVETFGAFSAIAGVSGFAGIMAAIVEDEA